jgi:hypothetical protein
MTNAVIERYVLVGIHNGVASADGRNVAVALSQEPTVCCAALDCRRSSGIGQKMLSGQSTPVRIGALARCQKTKERISEGR